MTKDEKGTLGCIYVTGVLCLCTGIGSLFGFGGACIGFGVGLIVFGIIAQIEDIIEGKKGTKP